MYIYIYTYICRGYIGIMETAIICREILGFYRGYTGIMEKKMEATI